MNYFASLRPYSVWRYFGWQYYRTNIWLSCAVVIVYEHMDATSQLQNKSRGGKRNLEYFLRHSHPKHVMHEKEYKIRVEESQAYMRYYLYTFLLWKGTFGSIIIKNMSLLNIFLHFPFSHPHIRVKDSEG